MHFVLLEGCPKPDHADFGRVAGAYVSVFVRDRDAAAVETTARGLLEESGWELTAFEEPREVVLDAVPNG